MINTTTTNLVGRDVDVYFNLHRKCWSVRDRKTRRVVAHVDHIVLSDVSFRVSAAGNARVRREGKKNVHAFARGTVAEDQLRFFVEDTALVTYNPYKFTTFVDAENGWPIYGAAFASFDGKIVEALDTVSTCGRVAA